MWVVVARRALILRSRVEVLLAEMVILLKAHMGLPSIPLRSEASVQARLILLNFQLGITRLLGQAREVGFGPIVSLI